MCSTAVLGDCIFALVGGFIMILEACWVFVGSIARVGVGIGAGIIATMLGER